MNIHVVISFPERVFKFLEELGIHCIVFICQLKRNAGSPVLYLVTNLFVVCVVSSWHQCLL